MSGRVRRALAATARLSFAATVTSGALGVSVACMGAALDLGTSPQKDGGLDDDESADVRSAPSQAAAEEECVRASHGTALGSLTSLTERLTRKWYICASDSVYLEQLFPRDTAALDIRPAPMAHTCQGCTEMFVEPLRDARLGRFEPTGAPLRVAVSALDPDNASFFISYPASGESDASTGTAFAMRGVVDDNPLKLTLQENTIRRDAGNAQAYFVFVSVPPRGTP